MHEGMRGEGMEGGMWYGIAREGKVKSGTGTVGVNAKTGLRAYVFGYCAG